MPDSGGIPPQRTRSPPEPVAGCTLSDLLDKCLVWIAHVEHADTVQQRRAELFGGLVPQFACTLRQPNVAGAFRVSEAIDAGAPGMAAMPMRRRELIETRYGKAAPRQLNGGETAHGPQPDDGHVVVLARAHLLSLLGFAGCGKRPRRFSGSLSCTPSPRKECTKKSRRIAAGGMEWS